MHSTLLFALSVLGLAFVFAVMRPRLRFDLSLLLNYKIFSRLIGFKYFVTANCITVKKISLDVVLSE